jgi:hypothetical protein
MRIPLFALLLLTGCLAAAQTLQVQAVPPQGALVGQSYTLPLAVNGGQPPYTWRLTAGTLPPGLKLHSHAGKLLGVPSTAGDYQFTVVVTDSDIPASQTKYEITLHVIEGLSVEWKDAPAVHGNSIAGSLTATNQTGNDFVLTVVIVAVNQIGRATALGYQHFRLAANSTSPVIPFGSSPGLGTYYVRVDAAAHQPSHHRIFRASKQTTDPLQLTQF